MRRTDLFPPNRTISKPKTAGLRSPSYNPSRYLHFVAKKGCWYFIFGMRSYGRETNLFSLYSETKTTTKSNNVKTKNE